MDGWIEKKRLLLLLLCEFRCRRWPISVKYCYSRRFILLEIDWIFFKNVESFHFFFFFQAMINCCGYCWLVRLYFYRFNCFPTFFFQWKSSWIVDKWFIGLKPFISVDGAKCVCVIIFRRLNKYMAAWEEFGEKWGGVISSICQFGQTAAAGW
jgi:hypothetical protein